MLYVFSFGYSSHRTDSSLCSLTIANSVCWSIQSIREWDEKGAQLIIREWKGRKMLLWFNGFQPWDSFCLLHLIIHLILCSLSILFLSISIIVVVEGERKEVALMTFFFISLSPSCSPSFFTDLLNWTLSGKEESKRATLLLHPSPSRSIKGGKKGEWTLMSGLRMEPAEWRVEGKEQKCNGLINLVTRGTLWKRDFLSLFDFHGHFLPLLYFHSMILSLSLLSCDRMS